MKSKYGIILRVTKYKLSIREMKYDKERTNLIIFSTLVLYFVLSLNMSTVQWESYWKNIQNISEERSDGRNSHQMTGYSKNSYMWSADTFNVNESTFILFETLYEIIQYSSNSSSLCFGSIYVLNKQSTYSRSIWGVPRVGTYTALTNFMSLTGWFWEW